MRKIYYWLKSFGIDPIKFVNAIRGSGFYIRDYYIFINQQKKCIPLFPIKSFYPCLDDRYSKSGAATGHYFHQDLLVARRINDDNPIRHIDIGSRVDGFVAHVASFREIEVIDIRSMTSKVKNIKFIRADMMNLVPHELIGSCDSLSCLHAIEHFGLGRYGEPINCNGYFSGFENLSLILKSGGKLYLSTPIGPQRIEFNAHRIFSLEYLLSCLSDKFRLNQFSYIDDSGDLHENVQLSTGQIKNNFGCQYGCGVLEMTKI